MLAIVDSGGANIASVRFALERLGIHSELTADPAVIRSAERVILPGVGSAFFGAADVPNPMALKLQTTVNGKVTQSGSTADMIFDVPTLIEYFSSFMTLNPGDLILTGTPDGIVNVNPGDVVVTEIEGIGQLTNTLVSI